MSNPSTPLMFDQSFPVQTAQAFPLAFSEHEAADRRILIVDDESSVREMFATWLRENFECKIATSADEALACLAVDSYAVVISDMMMPGRNGVELLREIAVKYPETAVIMVSGVDRPQRIRDALRVGAADYLTKPCDLDVLTLSVERALERRTLQRTARTYRAHLETQNIELANSKAELQRLQAQLVHTEKMASLGQLSAGIAHELNNPAGFIHGNMDVLRDYLPQLQKLLNAYDQLALSPDDSALIQKLKLEINYERSMDDLGSIVSDCREGAQRICDVVQNLRLFSRLDEAELKRVDISAGIDSTIRLLSRYYSSGQIHLRKDYGDLPLITCYASQINQVWMNLLVNAAQAIPQQGEVCVSTKLEGDWVIIEVSDSGPGIPEDQLSRIFDPFFTTKPVGEGTGLGLSISYGIIERHGGMITVKSKPGVGTTFRVRIPARTSEITEHKNKQTSPETN
jgi:two-component system NtrC family sensor kinase